MPFEFTLREWLMIIGVVVIVGVLLDGFRRARGSKRNSLKLSIDKNLRVRSGEKVDYFGGELPNGGARVVNPSTGPEETESAGEDELIPEPLFPDDEPGQGAKPEGERAAGAGIKRDEAKLEQLELEGVAGESADKAGSSTARDVEEVIGVNVFARDDQGFNGSDLARVVLACGMRYGDMSIFHRNEAEDGSGAVQFSMANIIKPGTFDIDNMGDFETPGVTFFMSLPGPKDSIKAFDFMLETAQCLAKNLDGELKDEQHSAMTAQTIEHSRQKIHDFQRRHLSSSK